MQPSPRIQGSLQNAPTRSASTTVYSKVEQYGLLIAFTLYLVFQFNAAMHHGSWGQDFQIHRDWIADAVMNPWKYFTHYDNSRTNPPLYHLFAALVYKMTGGFHFLEILALFSAVLNGAAMLLLYRIIRSQMRHELIRLSCLVFLLFLPFAMIHSIVVASDAFAPPIFIAVLYLLITLDRAVSDKAYFGRLLGIGLLLTIGIGVKFTFASLIVACFLSLGALLRTGLIDRRRFLGGVAALALLPVIPAIAELYQYRTQQSYNNGINMTGSEMNLRSILFFREHDLHVLDAPPFNERAAVSTPPLGDTPEISFELIQKNRYSYPALLELAVFSDILNIYQYDPDDGYFGKRSSTNQARMQLAVRTGVIFFGFVVVGSAFVFLKGLYVTFVAGKPECIAMSITGMAAGLYFLNIVAALPFVRAYYAGYWLPRLVHPALLCFVVMAFVALDRWSSKRSYAFAWACLALVLFQSAVHASFLWPSGPVKSSGGEIEVDAPLLETNKPSEAPCLSCQATAVFDRTDTNTQGSWKGVYGSRGFAIANEANILPDYARVTLPPNAAIWLQNAGGEPRALLNPQSRTARIASTWWDWNSLIIDVHLTDGYKHGLALYFVDWDSTRRAQKIDILDGETNALLDTRVLTAFHEGQYLVWNVRGHVKISVARTAEPNAVVSGLFLD